MCTTYGMHSGNVTIGSRSSYLKEFEFGERIGISWGEKKYVVCICGGICNAGSR